MESIIQCVKTLLSHISVVGRWKGGVKAQGLTEDFNIQPISFLINKLKPKRINSTYSTVACSPESVQKMPKASQSDKDMFLLFSIVEQWRAMLFVRKSLTYLNTYLFIPLRALLSLEKRISWGQQEVIWFHSFISCNRLWRLKKKSGSFIRIV